MDANLEQDLARLDYNETEIARRLGVVMADLNQYVCKKYPELKDADVIERPRNSRSVLDLCGLRVKQKDSGKPVIKLPNDKWEDYIPKRPQAEEADGDDEGDEEGTAPNEEIEEEGATINCVSNTQSNRESEDTDSDTNSLEEFGLDEYGDIVQETQLPLTDSQLSTVTVFDSEETQIPGKLY